VRTNVNNAAIPKNCAEKTCLNEDCDLRLFPAVSGVMPTVIIKAVALLV
jgi:hypothetical protein